jgi:hypothetical protein
MAELAGPRLPLRVARSEDELIKLARGLVGAGRPPSRVRAAKPIETIGPTAMKLLQQTLARGVIATLLRGGGWETRRTLVNGHSRRGRLWERHASLPPLHFGPASFALLIWLHDEDLVRPTRQLERNPNTTLADDVLHYLACEQLTRAGVDVCQPAFLHSPLCQLGFCEFLVGDGASLPAVDFGPLVAGPGSIIVEALQTNLVARWLDSEQRKGTIVLLDEMTRIGRAQDHVLGAWFAALDRVDPRRRDLAAFVAEAARQLLARGLERRCPDHRWWIRSLSLQAPLAARQGAFTAAAAFLRGVGRLGRWLDEAGLVAYFDDDYEAAQLLLANWQYLRARPELPTDQPQMPASILDRAATLARTLESLHSLGVPERAGPQTELP